MQRCFAEASSVRARTLESGGMLVPLTEIWPKLFSGWINGHWSFRSYPILLSFHNEKWVPSELPTSVSLVLFVSFRRALKLQHCRHSACFFCLHFCVGRFYNSVSGSYLILPVLKFWSSADTSRVHKASSMSPWFVKDGYFMSKVAECKKKIFILPQPVGAVLDAMRCASVTTQCHYLQLPCLQRGVLHIVKWIDSWFYSESNMGMDQYLLIPFLVGWTSIYQLFWYTAISTFLPEMGYPMVPPNPMLYHFTCERRTHLWSLCGVLRVDWTMLYIKCCFAV